MEILTATLYGVSKRLASERGNMSDYEILSLVIAVLGLAVMSIRNNDNK